MLVLISHVVRCINACVVSVGALLVIIRSKGEVQQMIGTSKENAGSRFVLNSPASGKVVPLTEIPDEIFSQGVIGLGVAVEPDEGKIYAPDDGKVLGLFKTLHAITMRTSFGAEILIHIGLDTVHLNGEHFVSHIKRGDVVRRGELIMECDINRIKEAGYHTVTSLIVCNTKEFVDITPKNEGSTTPNDIILTLTPMRKIG